MPSDASAEMVMVGPADIGTNIPTSDLGAISKLFRDAVSQKRSIREFSVSHQHDTGQHVTLLAREIDPKMPLEQALERATEIASELYSSAQNAVRAYTLPQMFTASCHKADGTPVSFHPFRCFPPPSNELAGLTQSPTDKGTLSQSMQLTHTFAKQAYMATQNEVERLERLLEKAYARIDTLESRQMDVATKYEEILSKQWERDKERRKEDREEKAVDKLFSAGMTVWKLVMLNQGFDMQKLLLAAGPSFLGGEEEKKPAGSAPAPEDKARELAKACLGFFASLKPEQLQKLQALLSDEQGGLLGKITTIAMGVLQAAPQKTDVETKKVA